MKESYWGYFLVLFGVFVIVILLLIRNITSNNTEDYFNEKEIAEQAMVDAIDYGYFRYFGEIRINKEKFIENFSRRFADAVSGNTDYDIKFVSIYEAPPKVSVEITSQTQSYVVGTDSEAFDIVTRINEILEQGESHISAGEVTEREPSIKDKIDECAIEKDAIKYFAYNYKNAYNCVSGNDICEIRNRDTLKGSDAGSLCSVYLKPCNPDSNATGYNEKMTNCQNYAKEIIDNLPEQISN